VNWLNDKNKSMINSICVFCASSKNVDPFFLDSAFELGTALAKMNIRIIYGGGKVGLMGRLSDGALANSGKVIGFIPEFMVAKEWGREDLDELNVVETIHHRESKLIHSADAIIALPGGIGTMEELLQALAWKFLGIIDKPVYIINLNGYYDDLLRMMEKSISEKFMGEAFVTSWKVFSSIDEVLTEIKSVNQSNNFSDFIPEQNLG
jgi:uncharacterized protein (TIGR00730 family)